MEWIINIFGNIVDIIDDIFTYTPTNSDIQTGTMVYNALTSSSSSDLNQQITDLRNQLIHKENELINIKEALHEAKKKLEVSKEKIIEQDTLIQKLIKKNKISYVIIGSLIIILSIITFFSINYNHFIQ